MCGIVGFYSTTCGPDRNKLERSCKLIRYRGPDASNVVVDDGVGLGHVRLSIIDLSDAAKQPMIAPSGQVVLVYNGEIYNYRQLREVLEAQGHKFRTKSDTEVLLHAYLEYGRDFLRHLQGMFALAIWDKRTRSLLLARDRLGIKPLYYREDCNTVTFSSEIKALLALDNVSPRVDRQSLHDYLTFRYTIAPRTMFEGIRKLPPAHCLHVLNGRTILEKYWTPDFRKTRSLSEEEWIDQLKQQVGDTCISHLVADVPVGVFLSGGLDSSVVAASVQARLARPIKTFSVGFEEGGVYDERNYARKVARHIGSEHYEISLSPKQFVDTLPAFVWHMDEPVADSASIPLYFVAQLARRHVKVVLSGEGSDELLGGYAFWVQFKKYQRVKLFKMIPAVVRETLISGLNRALFRSSRLETYLTLSRQPLSRYGSLVPEFQDNVFTEEDKRRLYRSAYAEVTALEDSVEQVRAAYRSAEAFEFLDQMLYVSMTQWLPDDLLMKADKMTMAHSLELRVPFLDHKLVEFIAQMPTNLKVRKCGGSYSVKYALKRAFSRMLPEEIVERPKLGWPVPYARWFKKEMRDLLQDVLLSQAVRGSEIFNHVEVEGLLSRVLHQTEEADPWNLDAKKVWQLFLFELWRQQYKVLCP